MSELKVGEEVKAFDLALEKGLEVEHLKMKIAFMRGQFQMLQAQRDRLKAALEIVQWDQESFCVSCLEHESGGHKPSCSVGEALAL